MFYILMFYYSFILSNSAKHKYARVDLGAMLMKGYYVFPKAPALLKPHHQIVKCHIQDTRWGRVLSLSRKAVYSTSLADWAKISVRISE